jgi:hypothetical protein
MMWESKRGSEQSFNEQTRSTNLPASAVESFKRPSATYKAKNALKYVILRKPVLLGTVLFIVLAAFAVVPREYVVGVSGSNCYSFSVKVTTVIAGRNSWEVPWIWFAFKDEKNSYYLLLHSNGVLELSRITNGVRIVGLAFVNTSLTPFEGHIFEVNVKNTKVEVYVDNVQYVVVEDNFVKTGAIKVSATPNILFIVNTQHLTTYESSELCTTYFGGF